MNTLEALRIKFPNLKLPELSELESLSPADLGILTSQLEDAVRQLDQDVVASRTRLEAAEQTLTETREKINKEFGVNTLSELEAKLTELSQQLKTIYEQAEASPSV